MTASAHLSSELGFSMVTPTTSIWVRLLFFGVPHLAGEVAVPVQQLPHARGLEVAVVFVKEPADLG